MILEIRTYRMKPGRRGDFHRVLVDEALALLREHNIRVVRYGPSLHDDNSYVLIRAFDNLEARTEQEARFYGSREWLERFDARVMAMIETYTTVVIEVAAGAATAVAHTS